MWLVGLWSPSGRDAVERHSCAVSGHEPQALVDCALTQGPGAVSGGSLLPLLPSPTQPRADPPGPARQPGQQGPLWWEVLAACRAWASSRMSATSPSHKWALSLQPHQEQDRLRTEDGPLVRWQGLPPQVSQQRLPQGYGGHGGRVTAPAVLPCPPRHVPAVSG